MALHKIRVRLHEQGFRTIEHEIEVPVARQQPVVLVWRGMAYDQNGDTNDYWAVETHVIPDADAGTPLETT